jgi:hypothetical protein
MGVSVLTFVNWRAMLVATQAALVPTLSNAQGAEGYALLAALQTAGAAYDASGDDSPRNTSTFSTGTCQPYMIAAVPLFAEWDRISRLIYTTYASNATLAQGQAFGLYAGLTALPAGLQSPTALALLWNAATALWASALARATAAEALFVASVGPTGPLLGLLLNAGGAVAPYFTPPVDPSPAAALASSNATVAVNAAVTNCQTWIASLNFS